MDSAADFFAGIGEDTATTVIWPSRLKIGAKSKKGTYLSRRGFYGNRKVNNFDVGRSTHSHRRFRRAQCQEGQGQDNGVLGHQVRFQLISLFMLLCSTVLLCV